MLNDLNEKLFDSKHTEDIEGFSFDSKDRPVYRLNMSRLLSIFKETDEYINAEELRVAYYRKFGNEPDFINLSLAQVKYLVNILNHQHDFKRRGNKYKYNTNERSKIDYYEVAMLFKDKTMSTDEAYTLYKEKIKSNNLPKNAFINTLRYLYNKNCLSRTLEKKRCTYSLNDISVLSSRLEQTVDHGLLDNTVHDKHLNFNEVCSSLGTTRGKLLGSLKRTGIKWESRRKKKVRDTRTGKVWESLSSCAKDLKVSRQHVNQSMKRNSPVKGVYLEFFED